MRAANVLGQVFVMSHVWPASSQSIVADEMSQPTLLKVNFKAHAGPLTMAHGNLQPASLDKPSSATCISPMGAFFSPHRGGPSEKGLTMRFVSGVKLLCAGKGEVNFKRPPLHPSSGATSGQAPKPSQLGVADAGHRDSVACDFFVAGF